MPADCRSSTASRSRPSSSSSRHSPAGAAGGGHPAPAAVRASRATCRACRSGAGVRASVVDAARTTSMAVSSRVRQPGWMSRGRVSLRVQTQAATRRPWRSTGATSPRSGSTGGAEGPSNPRCVTPIVGRPSAAPRWMARPALRGWSRPVASTSSTSGTDGSSRTAAARIGPSRRARRPGEYDAGTRSATTDRASTSPEWACRRHVTAPAQARSPGFPGPASPRSNATKHPPTAGSARGRHWSCSVSASTDWASWCCNSMSCSGPSGQYAIGRDGRSRTMAPEDAPGGSERHDPAARLRPLQYRRRPAARVVVGTPTRQGGT